jgi:hypothetical protein
MVGGQTAIVFASAGSTRDAGARSRPGLESGRRDWLATSLTQSVSPARDLLSRIFDVGEVTLVLLDQGFQLRTLEGDRGPLRVMLVISIGVRRGVHNALEASSQDRQRLAKGRTFGLQTGQNPLRIGL